MEDPDNDANDSVRGRWGLAYVGATGRGTMVFPASLDAARPGEPSQDAENFRDGAIEHWSLIARPPFDFNGDGVPEILIRSSLHQETAGDWGVGNVWTVRDGSLVHYPPTAGINVADLRDEDNDGRPDVVIWFPYEHRVDLGIGGADYSGVELVGHSLSDGTFSFTDAVASASARQSCPNRSVPTVVRAGAPGRMDSAFDLGATARNALCARVWGVASREIIDELDRAGLPAARERRHRGRHGTSVTREEFTEAREMARLIPPTDFETIAAGTPVPRLAPAVPDANDLMVLRSEVRRLSALALSSPGLDAALSSLENLSLRSDAGRRMRDVCAVGLRARAAAMEIQRLSVGTTGSARPSSALTFNEYSRVTVLRSRVDDTSDGAPPLAACEQLLSRGAGGGAP